MALSSILRNEKFEVLQDVVYGMPTFPYLWIPHCILMSMAVRATVGGLNFSRTHPLACYMMTVVYTFPGGILASVLLAEPPLAFLANTPAIIAMSLAWYMVFYAPYDFFVKLVGVLHLRLPLGFLQDVLRIKLVISGIETIHAVYPNTILYPFVFATVKSSGFMFIKYIEGLVYGKKIPNGFVVPNHHSKTCMLAAVLFIASDIGFLEVEKKLLLLLCISIALSLRLASMLPSAHNEPDPYIIFENVACYILFGKEEEKIEKKCDLKDETNMTHNGRNHENVFSQKAPENGKKNKVKNQKV